jgi:hypothetical protein
LHNPHHNGLKASQDASGRLLVDSSGSSSVLCQGAYPTFIFLVFLAFLEVAAASVRLRVPVIHQGGKPISLQHQIRQDMLANPL